MSQVAKTVQDIYKFELINENKHLNTILFLGLLTLVFIGIPIGLGVLLYYVPKKLGYPKIAKYLTISYGLLVISFGLYFAFEDHFFFKSNAIELLNEHNVVLEDPFKIISNRSGGFLDYSHQFTLSISHSDKEKLINQITSSDNYQEKVNDMFDLRTDKLRYSDNDTTFTANYQNKWNYIYEYYKPNKKGYKPTWDKILISKTKSELTYLRVLD